MSNGNGNYSKRFLRGPERKRIGQDINDKRYVPEGNSEAPHLYATSTYRKAAMEYANANRIDPKPLRAVELMQLTLHKNIIHKYAINPLTVQYWTSHQRRVYNRMWKNKESTVSLDATGGVIRTIVRPNGEKSNVIYIYFLVVHSPSGQTSVAQMITKKTF